uniref:Uncharacterized protein n=1 Tax=Aegilops tauschii subsp. strangulata TaxID=200361 RepID=A0A453LLY5_AEGTS
SPSPMASRSCTFLEILLAVILPPLGVFLRYGCCSVSNPPPSSPLLGWMNPCWILIYSILITVLIGLFFLSALSRWSS